MVVIDEQKCVGCGYCIEDCVGGVLSLENGRAEVKKPCIQCGHCVAICPVEAVCISEYDMEDVEEYNRNTFQVEIGNLLHMIKFRRSIRKYKDQKIDGRHLFNIIQAGRYTATAVNSQGCYFAVVQEGLSRLKESIWQQIEELSSSQDKPLNKTLLPYAGFNRRRKADPEDDFLFRNAPAVIFIGCKNPIDAGLAAQNMELAAVSMGLGMLYNGYLARITEQNPAMKEWLGLDVPIQACMLAGYPDVEYRRTAPRKKANVIWR